MWEKANDSHLILAQKSHRPPLSFPTAKSIAAISSLVPNKLLDEDLNNFSASTSPEVGILKQEEKRGDYSLIGN